MEIHILKKQGKSIRAISRLLGISRNTVRKYLSQPETEPTYKSRPSKVAKLDPYKGYIQSRLKVASPDWIPASVLFREIKEQGYPGGASMLRNYMRTLKPVVKPEPLIRFETKPGKQMQVDWCVLKRGKAPLSAFVATLGYSRATYVEFVSNEKFETLKLCHHNAFEFFQGIPQEVLYDNMRTVVTQRNAYGEGQHRFHAGLWQLAKDCGFTPKLCKPYRAQTKGKVERFIHYLRYSFYIPLVSQFKQAGLDADQEVLNIEVRKWLRDVAHQRVHGTTKETPQSRLNEERLHLQTFAEVPAVQPNALTSQDIPNLTVPRYPVEQLQRSPDTYDSFLQEVNS